jgi:sec-independent protein translocase protein TatB
VFGINGPEFFLLLIIGVLVIGPQRLPEYTQKLANLVKEVRRMASGAREQIKEEVGIDIDDVDWKKYDPRQYDPRRIVREALLDPDPSSDGDPAHEPSFTPRGGHDPLLPTPYDDQAT